MPSSLVRDHLFNIFVANLYIYRPFGYPPPADAPHSSCQLPSLNASTESGLVTRTREESFFFLAK